jgi:homoserine acetyltransferase
MTLNERNRLFVEPISQIHEPDSLVAHFGPDDPLPMDAGVSIAPWQIAYQTYGTLDAARSKPGANTGSVIVPDTSPQV